MKIPKKIWPGIAAFSLVLLVFLGMPGKAHAIVDEGSLNDSNSYVFVDGATIEANISGAGKVTFIDTNVFDSGDRDRNYAPDDSAGFCDPKENIPDANNPSGLPKDIRFGINFDKKTNMNEGGTASIPAQLKLGINNGQNCIGVLKKITVLSIDHAAATKFQWNGNDIVNLNGNNDVLFNEAQNSGQKVFLKESDNACGADAAIRLDGSNQGIYVKIVDINRGIRPNPSDYPNISKFLKDNGSKCYIGTVYNPVYIAGTKGTAAAGFTPTGAATTEADDTTSRCVTTGHTALEWLLCPVTTSLGTAADKINDSIENQLNFKVDQNLSSNGPIHLAWTIIRDIASVILIILLLVMVFAQAIGGNFLDAYTVKKLLPRLVIAVIAMQISWEICRLIILLANDVGKGLTDILTLPFNGAGNLDLNSILHRLDPKWALGTQFIIPALLVGTVMISGLTVVGILFLALSLFASVCIGLAMLLFRNVLIVALVIFAPIAFMAWTLSGTQNYWKLWKDNFTKLLMLFPLLVAIIYTGRIFAWIAAGSGHAGLIDYVTVIIAFFAPYTIIPKAYKWGGGLLSSVAGAVWTGTQKYRNMPAKYAMERAKDNRHERAELRNARLADNQSAHPRWDRFLSGGYNYTLSRHARERKFESNRAQGRKTAEEAAIQAIVGSRYEAFDHAHKLDTLRTVAQGQFHAESGIDGTNNPTLQNWALDELAKYGDWDIISNLRAGGHVTERVWQKFVAKNISAIHQNAPHLSPQRTDLSELGYEDVGNWKDFEIEEAVRQASEGFVRDVRDGSEVRLTGEALAAQQQRWVAFARNALNDYQVSRRLTTAGRRNLELIANMELDRSLPDGRQVAVTEVAEFQGRRQGQPPEIILPNNIGTEEARRQLTTRLAEVDPAGRPTPTASAMTITLARRAVDAAPGSQDEANFVQYLHELRAQAATSPQAREVHNRLVDSFHHLLDEEVSRAERDNLAAGNSAADIDAGVTLQIQHGVDKMTRLGISRI